MTGDLTLAEDASTVQQVAPSFPLEIPLTLGAGELQADLVIYYCQAGAESLCLLEQVRLVLPLAVGGDMSTADLAYTIPLPKW